MFPVAIVPAIGQEELPHKQSKGRNIKERDITSSCTIGRGALFVWVACCPTNSASSAYTAHGVVLHEEKKRGSPVDASMCPPFSYQDHRAMYVSSLRFETSIYA